MTISKNTFPQRLTKIDDLTRRDHSYLEEEDECYFVGEYTARRGYNYSATNGLIINIKKRMDRRGKPEWQYKEQAIQDAAQAFRNAIGVDSLARWTLVPIPPSKAKGHHLYDDRLTRVLHAIAPNRSLDIREMLIQTHSTEPAHLQTKRRDPKSIEKIYRLDQELLIPIPERVIIVDDILTTGAHYRAAKSLISRQFPGVKIVGLFIARRAPDATDNGDLSI